MKKRAVAALLPLALLVVCLWRPDLDQVLSIGGDDGFELMKALLWARNPEAARQMWNDQPWLHTMLIGTAFRWFGEHAIIPRLFTLGSMAALLLACACLLRKWISPLAAGVMGLILLSTTPVTELVLSAMLELPAVAWAVVAVAIAYQTDGTFSRWRWMLSGAVFALAMQMKFTAAVVGPGLAALAWTWLGWRGMVRAWIWGLLGFAPVFSMVGALSPRFVPGELLLTHVFAHAQTTEAIQRSMQIAWEGLPCAFLAAAIGLTHPCLRRRAPPAWFAVVLLLTAIAIALLWRPWWDYYMIHFALPLGMLAALGVDRVVGPFWNPTRSNEAKAQEGDTLDGRTNAIVAPATAVAATAALAALWLAFALPGVARSVQAIHNAPACPDRAICRTFKAYALRAQWCFTRERDVAFQAGVLIPPELVVLSGKRFWTGQLTEAALAEKVRQFRPEILLLALSDLTKPYWSNWVYRSYVAVEREFGRELLVHESLNPVPRISDEEQLKRLGL